MIMINQSWLNLVSYYTVDPPAGVAGSRRRSHCVAGEYASSDRSCRRCEALPRRRDRKRTARATRGGRRRQRILLWCSTAPGIGTFSREAASRARGVASVARAFAPLLWPQLAASRGASPDLSTREREQITEGEASGRRRAGLCCVGRRLNLRG